MVQAAVFPEEDVSEGTVAAETVKTSMLDKVNHCVPNQDANWCSRCECHSQFSYFISTSRNSQGTTSTERYKCLECGCDMFLPRLVKRWAKGLLTFVFVAVVLLPLLDALLHIEERIQSEGMVLCFIALGVLAGFFGFWMRHKLTEWRTWSAKQRQKSRGELTREAEAHPHQPVYDLSNDDFDAWASQFMDPEALQQLHAKHGHDWSPRRRARKATGIMIRTSKSSTSRCMWPWLLPSLHFLLLTGQLRVKLTMKSMPANSRKSMPVNSK